MLSLNPNLSHQIVFQTLLVPRCCKIILSKCNGIAMAPAKKKGELTDQVEPGYHVQLKPDAWHALNRNHMQKWVQSTFNKQLEERPDACSLFTHQHLIKDFMQPNSPYRGLMLYHSLGSGKTRGSIAIAEVLSSSYKVTVMVPASLASNYVEEIRRCGNEHYRTTGKWTFISKNDKERFETEQKATLDMGVSEITIKRNGGVWIREPSKTPNIKSLGEKQSQIADQIDDMIRARYTFIHYNGLNQTKIRELKDSVPEGTSPFDGHLVIIDEVHNLVSRIVNESVISKALYHMIMTARNAKIILLSGTPLINRPVEVAIIANMVRGFMPYINIHATGVKSEQWRSLEAALKANSRVDYYDLDTVKSALTIYPVVEGFEWADKDKFLIKHASNASSLKHEISAILKANKINAKALRIEEGVSKLLPDKEKEFDQIFVDYSALNRNEDPISNRSLLSRRMQGIVSYYESFDPAKFPIVAPTKLVQVAMSDEVFKKYMGIRQDEFAKEAKNKANNRRNAGNNNELNSGNIYRAFSRALCNFSFPSHIKRPYPSTLAKLKLEGMNDNTISLDDDGDDDTDKAADKKKKREKDDFKSKYLASVMKAVTELKNESAQYLTGEGLEQFGPKYSAIIDNIISAPGHSLVYSQFRMVEGLGLLQLVLQTAGFVEFNISKGKDGEWLVDIDEDTLGAPKYAVFTGDKERNRLLMAIYNNELDLLPSKLYEGVEYIADNTSIPMTNLRGEMIKVMMITQSGAEGISLKNVRQVHILEPYWNEIRIKQVIGRAVRAGSHLALPKAEQHVDVFMYMSIFSEKQLKNTTVISRENSMTSDQYIYNISIKKSRITNQILNVIKSSAIDCLVHLPIHKDISCAKYPSNFGTPIPGVLYSYHGVHEDPTDDTIKRQICTTRRIGFVKCSKNDNGHSIRIPYYKDTMEVLDPKKFNDSDGVDLYIIGRILINEDGNPRVVLFDDDEGDA